jgi:chromosome segregation ATPase
VTDVENRTATLEADQNSVHTVIDDLTRVNTQLGDVETQITNVKDSQRTVIDTQIQPLLSQTETLSRNLTQFGTRLDKVETQAAIFQQSPDAAHDQVQELTVSNNILRGKTDEVQERLRDAEDNVTLARQSHVQLESTAKLSREMAETKRRNGHLIRQTPFSTHCCPRE